MAATARPWRPRRRGAARRPGHRRWWSRSAPPGCSPSPGTAAGRRGRRRRWPGNATGAGDAVAAGAGARPGARPALARAAAACGGPGGAASARRWPASSARPTTPALRRQRRSPQLGAALMPLAAPMADIVGPARAAGRGVGAFNVIGIEHAEAIVAGAEAAGAPVVLQISENCVAYHGALGPIAARLPGHRARGRGAGRGAPGPRDQRGPGPGGARGSASARSCSTRPGCPTRTTCGPRPSVARLVPRRGDLGGGGAGRDRRQRRRARARRAHRPGRGGRATSRRPGWTRWPSRSAARTPC